MRSSLPSGVIQGPPPPPVDWGSGGGGSGPEGRGADRRASFIGLFVLLAATGMVFAALSMAFWMRHSTSDLKDHANYRIIVSESGDFVRSRGREVMQQILKDLAEKGQKMDVLFAHNDDMAIGAIQAMEAEGIKPGKDVVIVSVDGIRDAFTAMIAGKINCSVECSPLLGPQLMKAIKDYLSGKVLPVKIITSERVFPAEIARMELPFRKY